MYKHTSQGCCFWRTQRRSNREIPGRDRGWGDKQSQRSVSPPLWFPGLPYSCPTLSSCLAHATIAWEESLPLGEFSICPESLGMPAGNTRTLESFAFLPPKLCRALVVTRKQEGRFPEAWYYCGGSLLIGSRSLHSGKGRGESGSCAWWQLTGEYWKAQSTAARERKKHTRLCPVELSKVKMGKATQSP